MHSKNRSQEWEEHWLEHPVLRCPQAKRKKKTGAFQALPMVPTAEEHLAAALKRAARVTPSAKLKNEAAKARNKASRKMDGAQYQAPPLILPCWAACLSWLGTPVLQLSLSVLWSGGCI